MNQMLNNANTYYRPIAGNIRRGDKRGRPKKEKLFVIRQSFLQKSAESCQTTNRQHPLPHLPVLQPICRLFDVHRDCTSPQRISSTRSPVLFRRHINYTFFRADWYQVIKKTTIFVAVISTNNNLKIYENGLRN